jgi:hypothetical protein
MERNLLVSHSTMIRKPLTFAIVLLIAVLAPAAAIIGFCARMPCCSHSSLASLAFATERADCCTTIACYESPSAKMAKAASSADTISSPSLVVAAPVPASPPVAHAVVDTSPPRTLRYRLAILSVLVI